MKQATAGANPAETAETTVTTVWPSIAALSPGRLLGRMYDVRWPDFYFFRLGNLFALLSLATLVPTALYFSKVLPRFGTRYRLTNRRILTCRGLSAKEQSAVDLTDFDSIEIDVLPGQEWFHAGDLVFRHQGTEVYRLPGVARPEPFRQTILKTRMASVGVRQVLQQQAG
jgi:hypothetical protein